MGQGEGEAAVGKKSSVFGHVKFEKPIRFFKEAFRHMILELRDVFFIDREQISLCLGPVTWPGTCLMNEFLQHMFMELFP